jgi:predicted phosphodiesterase
VVSLRIAMFGDVHANTIALDQALAAIERQEPDAIVCLGDVATVGYDPAGAVRRVAALGCPVVMGNGEQSLFDPPDRSAVTDPEARERIRRVDELHEWGKAQLSREELARIRDYLPVVELDAGGLSICVCHGSPRSAWEPLLASTAEEQVLEALAGTRADMIVGGHTHVPLLRRVGERWLVNAGSVGAPFSAYGGWGQVPVRPVAQWLVVTIEPADWELSFHEVTIDMEAVHDAARDSGMPHAEWWCGLWRGS